ncbi:uncharacterized protein LOC110704882 [Chenopodium quinoa]|uniref:uncharacterized protein LOC110704882 n=1 Tax=Chenopodium quinoa TaxID=63459 RepID=UPI000B76F2E3|nr:uncharacterized protein LOC110704882 [Chenopodium quinoa]
MANQSIVSIAAPEDLCNWEFVNRIYDLVESIDSLSVSSSSEVDDDGAKEDDEENEPTNDVIKNLDYDGMKCSRVSDLGQNHDVDLSKFGDDYHEKPDVFFEFSDGSNLNFHGYVHDAAADDVQDDEDDDDVHDDDDGGYGMDDELVPWEVKDRFVRQRMIKSGKNSFGKMAKSKKSARVFTRPGCVRGKHGLGLKVY